MEFAISATLMLTLVFAAVDFSRAIFIKEVITNLSGEGSSMASRGSTLSATASAVVAASAPLNLNLNGTVIVSSVFNNNNHLQLTGQVSQGGMGATSQIGHQIGGAAILPALVTPQLNQTVYVTEVFYKYTPITPIGKFLIGIVLPSQSYDVAYY
ncbi:MAG: TadE family protein [Candidatus Korobacteraceae bacterium]